MHTLKKRKEKERVPIESNITNNLWDDYIANESFSITVRSILTICWSSVISHLTICGSGNFF